MADDSKRFTVIEHEGYSERELFEGETLEDVWRKIGEKIGKEQAVAR